MVVYKLDEGRGLERGSNWRGKLRLKLLRIPNSESHVIFTNVLRRLDPDVGFDLVKLDLNDQWNDVPN